MLIDINSAEKNDEDDVVINNNAILELKTHIKINLSSLKEFNKIMTIKYNKDENTIEKNYDKELDLVFLKGINQMKRELCEQTSILLHKNKTPRADVWNKLGLIASEFLKCHTYPIIPSSILETILNKALGTIDYRVKKDYRKTVLLYCNISERIIDRGDRGLGQLDVHVFVELIPKQYLIF